MKTRSANPIFFKKHGFAIIAGLFLLLLSTVSSAQLGIYQFTGPGACPNQNPAVTTQPANAVFSNFTYTSPYGNCTPTNNVFSTIYMNNANVIDFNDYLSFTITPNGGFALKLDSLKFNIVAEILQANNRWFIRSSLDNYSTDISTGTITTTLQTASVSLTAANYQNISAITFRLYIVKINTNGKLFLDDVQLFGTTFAVPVTPANPTSNSPQCASPGVTMNFNGTAPAGVTWYWQTSATGTSTANSASSNTVTSSGTYYVRAQDNISLGWSFGAGSVSVVISPNVGTPVFASGATSIRCQGAGTVTYTASASNFSDLTYSLDAASLAAGNAINPATGAVTYDAAWLGTSTISVTAGGCNGPTTANHLATTNVSATTPVFNDGPASTRCQGTGTVTYTATASNTTGITYSLDALSISFGNSINATTGAVTYAANWNGTSTITASAASCGSPLTADHEVTITPTVGTPAFDLGPTSTRCQGAATVNYNATATNSTTLTYSLDAGSLSGGNSINTATGDVTFVAGWSGTSLITVEATGCNGPKSASHTVTINALVTTPVFTLGAASNRCKGGNTVIYTATASNATSLTYSLDAASISGGVTINASTGAVTYPSGWTGTTSITVSAAGCSGPNTAVHNATSWADNNNPVFAMGNSSTRCQGAGTVTYTATDPNAYLGISYSLDATSLAAGNTINTATGAVTYTAGWSGNSTITATSNGCAGLKNQNHSVTTNPSVQAPVFEWGASSTRCQKGETVNYRSAAANNTSITYTLDAASLAAGNTITTGGGGAEGKVTFTAGWTGTSVVTAIASGCNGPVSTTHTITTNANVGTPIFTLGAASTRCQGAGLVNYGATAANNTGITFSLNGTATTAGNTINASTGDVTYTAAWTGSTIITATAAGCNGPATATHTVTITPTVGTPVFTLGATTTRCQGAGTVTYSATASNNTGISYSLDAASTSAGNTINAATGAVTYNAGWTGTSFITATATGCNGPKSATHTVTVNPSVTAPVFTLGTTSTRCFGAGTVTYTATASNATGISYTLDATSLFWGNTINAASGAVMYTFAWFGTSVITATAAGCNGPVSSTHTVTVVGGVGTPVFTLGAASTRCQGAGTIIYNATAVNSTGISYSLDAASITGGNTINALTGEVTYAASWSGTTVITVTATGCNGPKSATHTVTVTPTVETPVFTAGAASTRCQGAGTVTYTATSPSSTSMVYSLDAGSLTGGNTINAATGAVTYVAGWTGTTIISVFANGCNGPSATVTHTVTITPTVGTPVFTLGSTSTRCQGAGTVTYDASATVTTGITYTLNAASTSGGNSINAVTGEVTYVASWSGTTIITASAAGCNGPKTAIHTVTVKPTVGTPVFTLGASSVRCEGAGTVTYTANATNNTGITYDLDAASQFAGNSINTATGAVTYLPAWTGSSVITATATGCNGPSTAVHTVTTTPTVGTPVFSLGATSVRCQGSAFVAYTATASNATAITYTLDAASTAAGNTINSLTGVVVYLAGWNGTSIITANAAGCNGPASDIHTVTTTPTVGVPVFTAGSTSVRCQGAGTETYTASSTNSTGMTYSLDATSTAAGNTIVTTTGEVTYVATWNGTSVITASAMGCNGPVTANHTVTITPTVGTPVFSMGLQSVRTQGAGMVTYGATATNNTGITYTLDPASISAGNTINAATGAVTWAAGWFGLSAVTATATGCNGPTTSSHIVNINPSVVQTPLYLSDPGQLLDRIDPVAANIIPTALSYPISTTPSGILADATTTVSAVTGPVTVSHTTGTGANRFMLVGISQPNRTVTSVTYGGTALTLVGENNINANARISLYKLSNPPSGTANVVVNYSTVPDFGTVVNVSTFSGVDLTNPLGTFVSAQAKSNTPSVTVTAAANELVYDVIAVRNKAITVGAGQTQKWNQNSGSEIEGAGSTKPGAASVTMSWSAGNGVQPDWAMGAVSLKPASSAANIVFTQSPVLCSTLVIKAQTIQMLIYVNVTSGAMPVNPAITAALKYGSTNIISLSNPVYNSGTKILSWTGILGADVTVPSGQALTLEIVSAQPGVQFQIEYHSKTRPSRISLLPVSTYIDFITFDVYNAPYPGGSKRISGNVNTQYYARAVVTTPFGYTDITGMDIKINPPGTTVPVTCVDSTSCTRTYEYPWTTSGSTGMYYLLATAKEGYENLIKNSELLAFDVCAVCPPVALNDSATGAGGAPILVDVLTNDYDPNNNIKLSTLAINTQPNNGSGFISNGKVVYLPNGSYAGRDTLVYQICDSTNACATAYVYFTINPLLIDPCSEATKSHVYFMPFAENEARMALDSSTNIALASNNIRSVISLKMPYPGMTIVWDHWEDGYEINALDPLQGTTKVWGDGNPYNGIAPGYASDIIPAGASIVLNDTIPTNPRVATNFYYDGRDKITTSGQITMTQVCGEPSIMQVQCMKTNVTPVSDYGTSFTIPVGTDFNSQDFSYSALFIRAAQNNTTVSLDKDNNGSLETTALLNEGEVLLINGGVKTGATVTSTAPIGVELHFGGNDGYSSRDVPIFPASWYSNIYYTPVPTTGSATAIKDTNAVLLYNSLNRPLTINWTTSAVPSSGSINLPAKTVVRFPLPLSATAAYKFVNPTGESFTAIEVCDSYTPGGGSNSGTQFDWSFNLIAQSRLTDFATVAWAPGSIDGTRNDNPIWVTPTSNTTIYVKYNGDVSGSTGLLSPCGLRYDVSYVLNALTHKRLLDPNDKDQSGLAVYTCNGAKLAAVYGEDASTAVTANPSWDVGSTIQPFCKQKLIFANDDYGRTMVNQPVTIPVLLNDFGFLSVVDPASVTNTALLQPNHGTIYINTNGTIIYTPDTGYTGKDTFEYNVCSTPTPVVCDVATVYVDISICPAPYTQNVIAGTVYMDKNDDGVNNDGGTGVAGPEVYLYVDGNCNNIAEPDELTDSVTVDGSGTYQFITYPERTVEDDFDGTGGARTCANGTDGSGAWLSNWTDINDPSVGFCNTSQSQANTDAEIYKDGAFSNALRLKGPNVSATRTVNLSGAGYAFLSFSYRRKSATLTAGEDVIVQASSNGTAFGTVFTIAGDGTTDAGYVNIMNQDITNYAAATTYLRFLTNANVDDQDTVYIDNVKIQFIRYPICYITKLNTATVPAYHHTTTVLQHSLVASSAQTCLAPFDFGIAKNKITISGTLFQDPNGITDGLVNGTAIGTIMGNAMYAYLVDSTGLVVRRTTLNAATGAYSFTDADVFTNYTLRLSTLSVNLGDTPPSNAGTAYVAGNWVPTGDAFGVNNAAGTGLKPGAAACDITVTTAAVNVTAVNFGIERLPDSDDKTLLYSMNTPNVQYDITGGLTGSDPEDGVLGSGKTYKITQLPSRAVLYYNGFACTLNQVITGFNPALLKIDPDDDTHQAIFKFASRDAAGLYDPSPATVTVNWAQTLPVRLISFSGRLNGTRVDLNWVTANELNTKNFEVERSADGRNFSKLATVAARGNSSTATSYDLVDPDPIKGINYYRLKMIDLDGKFEYSQIVIIRIDGVTQLVTKIAPNPFTGKIDVYLTLTHNTMVEFRFFGINGSIVYKKSVKGLKGFNWFTINDLDKLPAAPYMLHIVTDDATIVEKLIKQ